MARKADIACEWLTGFNPAQSSRGFPCKDEDGRIWFPWGHLFFPFFCTRFFSVGKASSLPPTWR